MLYVGVLRFISFRFFPRILNCQIASFLFTCPSNFICPLLIILIINDIFIYAISVLKWSFALNEYLLLQKKQINREEDMLGCEVRSEFPQIQEMIDAKEPFDRLWRAVVTFHDKQDHTLTNIYKLYNRITTRVLINNGRFRVVWRSQCKNCFLYAERFGCKKNSLSFALLI